MTAVLGKDLVGLEHLDRHTLKRPRQGAGVQDGGPSGGGPAHLRLGS